MTVDTVDEVLAAGSGHSLVSGVLSLEGTEAEELMPDLVQDTRHRMLPRPQGVLAVHIKTVKFRTRQFASFFDSGSSIGVYLHLHMFGKTRATAVYKNVQFPSTIAFDDIKHFTVWPNPKHYDEENQIRLELIGYDRPDVHQIIAWRCVHVYDIIKNMYVADNYKMVSKDSKPVAEVEIEYCFAYGRMGYGASNQLENNKARPWDLISHSMFARPAPPAGRQMDDDTDVMSCIPVGHPTFVNFPHKSQLSAKHEYAPIATNANISIEPMIVAKRIKRRMQLHQEELDSLKTRKQRLKFIRGIANSATLNHASDIDEFMVPNSLRLKEYDGSMLNAFNQVSRPATAASDYDGGDLGDLDAVMELAPGLQQAPRSRSRPVNLPSDSDMSRGSESSGSLGEAGRGRGLGARLCDWLSAPFRRRRPAVVPTESIHTEPTESVMSYEVHPTYSYYSAEINVLTQDRADPTLDELPVDDPSLEVVKRRIIEADNMLFTDEEFTEFNQDQAFRLSNPGGDGGEGELRQRRVVPNVL